MDEYALTFARSARKELQRFDSSTARRVLERIEPLTQNPRPPGCRKIVGHPGLWRIRVGQLRVVYSLDDVTRVVDIVAIRPRATAYR